MPKPKNMILPKVLYPIWPPCTSQVKERTTRIHIMEICNLNAGNKNGAAIPNARRQRYKIIF
jgi:hypothetical protein